MLILVEYVFRKPTGSPADRGAAPPRYRREDGPAGMIIERDVPVPVRGGVTVYADVFRPAGGRPAPPLIAWSPYGKHAGPQLPLEIEILPSGTRFGPGETLRLVIQGRDIYRYPRPLIQALHDDLVNRGRHVIYSGGGYDSHLLVPVLSA